MTTTTRYMIHYFYYLQTYPAHVELIEASSSEEAVAEAKRRHPDARSASVAHTD